MVASICTAKVPRITTPASLSRSGTSLTEKPTERPGSYPGNIPAKARRGLSSILPQDLRLRRRHGLAYKLTVRSIGALVSVIGRLPLKLGRTSAGQAGAGGRHLGWAGRAKGPP